MHFTINIILVIITVLVSIGAFSNQKIMDDLIFYPPMIRRNNQWYRFITHGLIHADAAHLIFNMIALYSFGNGLEENFGCIFGATGKWIYLVLYLGGLICASIPDMIKHHDNYYFRSLGASGAVSAVIFGGVLLTPKAGIGLMFIPITIPGWIFGILYLIVSAYLDKKGGSNVNHGAHLWGAIYGLIFTIIVVYAWSQYDLFQNFKEMLLDPEPYNRLCDFQ